MVSIPRNGPFRRRYQALHRAGQDRITPSLPPEQFGSCSVDFRLGAEFNVFEHSRHAFIDLRSKIALEGIMRTVKVEPGRAVRSATA